MGLNIAYSRILSKILYSLLRSLLILKGVFYFVMQYLIAPKCHTVPDNYIAPAFLQLMIFALLNKCNRGQIKFQKRLIN